MKIEFREVTHQFDETYMGHKIFFHPCYETAAGHRSCDVGAARPRLRAVLGEGVEQLVYLFQSANQCRRVTPRRDGLWDAPLGESFFLPGVLQGQPEWVRCPAALRAPLLTLFWANDLDQEGFPSDDRQLDYAIDVLVTSWSARVRARTRVRVSP